MGETAPIAEVARAVSVEIFEVFEWDMLTGIDRDQPCSDPEHQMKTHPLDAIYWYDDPYSGFRIYFNSDLKSYSKGSINTGMLAPAVTSLCKAVDCANMGPTWKKRYSDPDVSSRVAGLLFVYNHDGAYDGDFDALLRTIPWDKNELLPGHRVYILGPRQISHLATVAADILKLRGRGSLSAKQHCQFWYPDLVGTKHRSLEKVPATIEMLTGPWIVMRDQPEGSTAATYYIWYRENGETIDEFKYLIDFFFRYQILNDSNDKAQIEVRFVNSSPEAKGNFERAKTSFANDLYGLPLSRLRERITCDRVNWVHPSFSTVDAGWNRG